MIPNMIPVIEEQLREKDKEIERLNNIIKGLDNTIENLEEVVEHKENIMKEVREILKYHLSNPSGTKNGWHIDIWNSEDISKLNENLGILDKVEENK